jgi:hypothetical protein
VRNYPAPQNSKEFQRELDRLGGRDLNGKSRFRVSWCQELKSWARGMIRIKYPMGWTSEFGWEWGIKEIGKYGEDVIRSATQREWREAKEAGIPTFHKRVSWHVEFIGEPKWVVEEYSPPDKMLNESPENWERNRYKYYKPNDKPEMWVPLQYIPHLDLWKEDVEGPFPHEGIYQDMIFLDKLTPKALDLVKMGMQARDRVEEQDSKLKYQSQFSQYYDPHYVALEEDEILSDMTDVMRDYKYIDFPSLYPRVAMREVNPEKANKFTKLGRANVN